MTPHEVEEKMAAANGERQGYLSLSLMIARNFFITDTLPLFKWQSSCRHTRTFTIGDVIARYKRMLGYNVLFPWVFMPQERNSWPCWTDSKERSWDHPVYNQLHQIPLEVLENIKTPEQVVEYFSIQDKLLWKVSAFHDWRRKFTTTDPHYKKMITGSSTCFKVWTKCKRGASCQMCPQDDNPVEDPRYFRGEMPRSSNYAYKFQTGWWYSFPGATLRPNTVFGYTKPVVNPKSCTIEGQSERRDWISE